MRSNLCLPSGKNMFMQNTYNPDAVDHIHDMYMTRSKYLQIFLFYLLIFCSHTHTADSYETSSRRKQPDRSKRSHLRRSPTSSRHGHRQRHRDERSHSTSRRRHRERPAKDRTTPVKVKPIQYFFYSIVFAKDLFLFCCHLFDSILFL